MELSVSNIFTDKTAMVRVAERPEIVIAEDNDKVILLMSFTHQGSQFKRGKKDLKIGLQQRESKSSKVK